MSSLRFWGILALFAFLTFTCDVIADPGINATPEIQQFEITTTVDVVGLVTTTSDITWQITTPVRSKDYAELHLIDILGRDVAVSLGTAGLRQGQVPAAGGNGNGGILDTILIPGTYTFNHWQPAVSSPTWRRYDELRGTSILPGIKYDLTGGFGEQGDKNHIILAQSPLDPEMATYTSAYDADVIAQSGHTVFTKSLIINTGNKVTGESNIKAETGLTYVATDNGGNAIGSENLMLDGSSTWGTLSDKILCPFAAATTNVIPAYCNIVQAGSKYDLTIGSVTSSANDRFIGTDATAPVVLNYGINVKPYGTSQGQIPASGSTMGYIKAHIQEARGTNSTKSEDLIYSETASTQGTITAFNKVMAYQSGLSPLP